MGLIDIILNLAGVLLWLSWRQRTCGPAEAQAAARWVRVLALAHGGALGLVLALHWVHAVLIHG